jgi:hypothetical protein
MQNCSRENLKGYAHLGGLGVDVAAVLKCIKKTQGVRWIRLAEAQRTSLSTVMNLRVPYKAVNFLTS